MKDLNISEVSKLSGTPASKIRYYEEIGLIKSVGRVGLKRLFDPSVLDQLALIALGQTAGFRLDEIAQMFTTNGAIELDRDMLLKQADKIDQTIQRFIAVRDGLKHAAACRAPRHVECPRFQTYMNAAASGKLKPL